MNPIAVIIPCYNEENRFLIKPIREFINTHKNRTDFYFVDDGSSDNTSGAIEKYFTDLENCFLLRLQENKGKGNAIREGIFFAKNKDYQYFAFIDADMEIPFSQIFKLYDSLQNTNCSLALTSRNLNQSMKLSNLRSIASVVMIGIANKILNMNPPIKDTQCGCKMLKHEIADLCFNEPFMSKWLFDIEILLRLKKRNNYRTEICEVPLLKIDKSAEKSNFKFYRNLNILKQLWQINKHYNA